MAQTNFWIADGNLIVTDGASSVELHSSDFRARTITDGDKEEIVIFSINHDAWHPDTKREWKRKLADTTLGINGAIVSPVNATQWAYWFNWACGTNIGFNTQYPQHIIADTIDLDTSIATQLTEYEKAGYMTISADEDNAGNVFVGDENVDSDSYQLEAGKSVFVELDDLSKWYAYGSVADCRVSICGAYKY